MPIKIKKIYLILNRPLKSLKISHTLFAESTLKLKVGQKSQALRIKKMPYRHPAPFKSITGGNSSGNLRREGESSEHPLSGGGGFPSAAFAMHQSLSALVDTTDNGKSKDKEKSPRSTPAAILALSLPVAGDQNAVRAKLRAACSFPPLLLSLFSHRIFTAPNSKVCCAL
jgi:hypothetical protein